MEGAYYLATDNLVGHCSFHGHKGDDKGHAIETLVAKV